jgi:hypothetical protein
MATFSFNPTRTDYSSNFAALSGQYNGIPSQIDQARQANSGVVSSIFSSKQNAINIPNQINQSSTASGSSVMQQIMNAGKAAGDAVKSTWAPKVTPLDQMIAQNNTAAMMRLS